MIDALLERYSDLVRGSLAADTAQFYSTDVRQFVNWCVQSNETLNVVKKATLTQYVRHLQPTSQLGYSSTDNRYATSTVIRKISAIRHFLSVLKEWGHIRHNPLSGVTIKDLGITRPTSTKPTHTPQLTIKPTPNNPQRIRDKAVLCLIFDEHLKTGQVVNLNISDINLDAKAITIQQSKMKSRICYLSPSSWEALTHWLAVRCMFHSGQDEAVIISLHWTSGRNTPGQRLSKRGLRLLISRYTDALCKASKQ